MVPRSCLMFVVPLAAANLSCQRSSQTWSNCTHDKPLIEVRLSSCPTDSCPRITSTHVLRLEDTFTDASLDIKNSYLTEAGDSTFSTSRCKGSVVAAYYCEEVRFDHRLILEFVPVPEGIGVRRAAYFFRTHCPPESAWDCDCNPPEKICHFDMSAGSNLTLVLSVKALAHEDPLRVEITVPLRAIPASVRRAAHVGTS